MSGSKISVSWDDDASKKVIVLRYNPGWTSPEFVHAIHDAYTLAASVEHTISTMSIFEAQDVAPPGFLRTLTIIGDTASPNVTLSVVVGGGAGIRMIFRIFQRVLPAEASRVCFASSVEDARAIIAQNDCETP